MASIRVHKYLPVACIYFFINAPAIFPLGLLVTGILSPLFYLWLLSKRRRFVIESYCLALLPFVFMNIVDGMVWRDFVQSSLLLLTAYVTVFAFAVAINETKHLDQVMRVIIWLNLALAVVGAVVRFTPMLALMWQIPDQYAQFRLVRYRGFTYEASYYSTLLTPLVLYSYWYAIQRRSRYGLYLLCATLIPLLMSLSYGAISALIVSLVVVHFRNGSGLARYKWIGVAAAIACLVLFGLPERNAIRQRAINVMMGEDDSEQIRTTDALVSAYAMAHSKDVWFGIGLGEIKDYGAQYMNLDQGVIPSAVAETLASFGILGLLIRFGMEGYLFYRTRPDEDPFRLSLFIWVFVFQFGGSFNGNIAEYMVWVLAFSRSVGFFSRRRNSAGISARDDGDYSELTGEPQIAPAAL